MMCLGRVLDDDQLAAKLSSFCWLPGCRFAVGLTSGQALIYKYTTFLGLSAEKVVALGSADGRCVEHLAICGDVLVAGAGSRLSIWRLELHETEASSTSNAAADGLVAVVTHADVINAHEGNITSVCFAASYVPDGCVLPPVFPL